MRYLFVMLILMLIAACTPPKKAEVVKEKIPVKPAVSGEFLWAIKPTVNIRKQPNVNSPKVATLADGDSVIVVNNKDGWYKVFTTDQDMGFVRSDLIGPKNLSTFPKAVKFADSLKEASSIKLLFDSKEQHKRILLQFPASAYQSRPDIRRETKRIGRMYQNSVYPGELNIHVIQPDSDDEYLREFFSSKINAEISLPVLPVGIVKKVMLKDRRQLLLEILVDEGESSQRLLNIARDIPEIYPITYTKIQVNFIAVSGKCLVSYSEDSAGNRHKFNKCLKF